MVCWRGSSGCQGTYQGVQMWIPGSSTLTLLMPKLARIPEAYRVASIVPRFSKMPRFTSVHGGCAVDGFMLPH